MPRRPDPNRPTYVPSGGRLRVEELAVLAAEFDALSEEANYRAVASEFVAWLKAERDASRFGLLSAGPRNAARGTPASKRRWNERRRASA